MHYFHSASLGSNSGQPQNSEAPHLLSAHRSSTPASSTPCIHATKCPLMAAAPPATSDSTFRTCGSGGAAAHSCCCSCRQRCCLPLSSTAAAGLTSRLLPIGALCASQARRCPQGRQRLLQGAGRAGPTGQQACAHQQRVVQALAQQQPAPPALPLVHRHPPAFVVDRRDGPVAGPARPCLQPLVEAPQHRRAHRLEVIGLQVGWAQVGPVAGWRDAQHVARQWQSGGKAAQGLPGQAWGGRWGLGAQSRRAWRQAGAWIPPPGSCRAAGEAGRRRGGQRAMPAHSAQRTLILTLNSPPSAASFRGASSPDSPLSPATRRRTSSITTCRGQQPRPAPSAAVPGSRGLPGGGGMHRGSARPRLASPLPPPAGESSS
jgi:hypothetical protein